MRKLEPKNSRRLSCLHLCDLRYIQAAGGDKLAPAGTGDLGVEIGVCSSHIELTDGKTSQRRLHVLIKDSLCCEGMVCYLDRVSAAARPNCYCSLYCS